MPQKYVYPATQYATANREYKGAEAVKGMLKKITMPTGGYEEFEYEPNKNSRYELVNTVTTNNVTGQGNTINGMPINVTYYSPNFNILRPQTVNIYYNLSHLEECGSANPADCAPFVDNTTVFATMQIYNGNTLVHNSVRKSYGVITFSLPLTVGNYYIKLIIKGRANLGLVTLTYDYAASNQYAWSDYEIGGVRVKKVTTYEPVTSKFTYKYYKYNKLNAPGRNLASSMVGPNYKTVIHTRSVCDATSFIINSISAILR